MNVTGIHLLDLFQKYSFTYTDIVNPHIFISGYQPLEITVLSGLSIRISIS